MILTSCAFGFFLSNSEIEIALPFACSMRCFAPSLNDNAATITECGRSPDPSTFPGTTIVSSGFVVRASRLMLTTRLCLVGRSKSDATRDQSAALELLLSLRKLWMSSSNTGFVLCVFLIVDYAGEGIRTLVSTKEQGPQPCAFDQLCHPRVYLRFSLNSLSNSVKRSAAFAKISAAESCPHGSMVNMKDVGSFSILTISSLMPSHASYKLCFSINLASIFPLLNI